MIHVTYPPGSYYLELRNCYEWRETIKAMADRPDVRWDNTQRCWFVDARLFDKLVRELGHVLAPIDADVFLRLPVDEPHKDTTPRRRRTLQDVAAEKERTRRLTPAAVRMIARMGGK